MMDFNYIKQQILTDDKIASAFEYMLSKMVLEHPVKPLKFIYKQCKIVLGNNKLYSVYDNKTGKKLYSKIHFQEVAKYIANNLKYPAKNSYILYIENELFRFQDKIDFFKKYYNQKQSDNIEVKLSAMFSQYFILRNTLICLLKEHNLC